MNSAQLKYLTQIINDTGVVTDILPLLVLPFCFKGLNASLQYFAGYFIINAVSDASQTLLLFQRVHNNLPVIHIYIMGSVLFAGGAYYHAFTSPVLKKATPWLSAACFLIMLVDTFPLENMMVYPSLSNTLLCLLTILFSLLYFYQLLTRKVFTRLEVQPLFWINTAFLFYFSTTMLFFALYKYILSAKLWN